MSRTVVLAILVVCLAGTGVWVGIRNSVGNSQPIRIGVLFSLTGTMAISETSLVEATQLAIQEINARGGILGRQIEIVLVDGQSDWEVFAREAERLIVEEQVSALFACWTSACRKSVKPVVERHSHLLIYPLQYEGLEASPNIVYTGSAPNQQIIPGTQWMMQQFGKRVYLVGSDYVFPRTANFITRDLIVASGGFVVDEQYRPLGDTLFRDIVKGIRRVQPDVILNTINGDSNRPFFEELARAGLHGIPVMSFSVAESELRALGPALYHPQHYVTWSYFQSIDTPENQRFVQRYREKFGQDKVTSDPVEAAYVGVHLWARAVEQAGRTDPEAVRRTIGRQSVASPSGIASVDRLTQHLWKMVRVGKVRADGQIDEVYTIDRPMRPVPFPGYRSQSDWREVERSIAEELQR